MEIAKQSKRTYIHCPHCKEQCSTIDHLFTDEYKNRTLGPWYCNECGKGYKPINKDGVIYVEKYNGDKTNKCLVFLKKADVMLVVKSFYFDHQDVSELEDHQEYRYNEHQCPSNYMSDVIDVIDLSNGDTDPHGIYEYIETIEYVEGYDYTQVYDRLAKENKTMVDE